jgi:hypothetical protein
MKATINGVTYDDRQAEMSSPDGDDYLCRTKQGLFFLVTESTFLDGRKLDDVPGLSIALGEGVRRLRRKQEERRERSYITREIIPLTDREAMTWCVKTQMPECFRGYVLEGHLTSV